MTKTTEIWAISELKGSDKDCDYYPCHFEGQDCTWCYCPFYPCLDTSTGGKLKISKKTRNEVWSCIDCTWIHHQKTAKTVLEGIRDLKGVDKDAIANLRLKIAGMEGAL
ncbi:MAG: cysteine-rich small domain-containing protein [Candidatus Hydrothermarchaeales archaeon]